MRCDQDRDGVTTGGDKDHIEFRLGAKQSTAEEETGPALILH